jgi:hypothetical protein
MAYVQIERGTGLQVERKVDQARTRSRDTASGHDRRLRQDESLVP